MKKMISALCSIVVPVLLSACSITGTTIPEDHYYRLPEVASEKQLRTPFKSQHIESVRVDGLYHERSLLYVRTDSPLELRRYHYHYWVEPPALLLTKHIQAYFKATDLSDQPPSSIAAELPMLKIVPRLLNFERLVGSGGIEVLIRLEFALEHSGVRPYDWTKIYTAQVKVDTTRMHDTVRAYGVAIDQIMQALSSDLLKLTDIPH